MESCEEDNLKELKELWIGVWILRNKDWNEWWEYKRKNNNEWIRRVESVMLQSEEVLDWFVATSEKKVWFIFEYVVFSSLSSREVQSSLVRMCNLVSVQVGGGGKRWMRHRVVCWMVGWTMKWIMKKDNESWSDETIDCVVNYLGELIENCEVVEMVKWAILTGEMWWMVMKMKMNSEGRDRLRSALIRHSTQTGTLVEAIDREGWDSERYQVGWCARWCEQNLFEEEVEWKPRVKLSSDQFEARCDEISSPVRSPFPVKSNVYFYEVIFVTNGEIQVGWCPNETRIGQYYATNEKYSIVLIVGNECFIKRNDQNYPIPTPSSFGSHNVVGCLLDLDNQRFEFHLNGQKLECPTQTHFSLQPYFATVYLTPHQQCHLNFGQCTFKFPPPLRFTTFHEQTGGDERKYRLVETEFWAKHFFWYKHTPVDNQVSLYFDDEIQNEVNSEVRRVEGDIQNDENIEEWEAADGKNDIRWRGVRYIQAIIEVMGKVDGVEKKDLLSQWVGNVIDKTVIFIYREKLLELVYPYLHLYPTQSNLTQHRSICIVLLHLIKCCRHYRGYRFIKPIHSSVFTYLTRTLTSSTDQWTQLFVLIALADLEMSETEKRQIESGAKIGQMVEKWRETFEEKDVAKLIEWEHEHRLFYQLYACSQMLLNSVSSNPANPKRTSPATLNPHDHSPYITLSPCHLSARSDWHWQSVRSVCQVSAHIYYFEVVLLTAGPMTIGWATKRTDLAKFVVGGDEFSVGFNGFDKTIWNDNKEHPVSNIPRWEPGDVIGCLLDPVNQKFTFTLNGQLVSLPSNIYFSSLPYHACVSLSSHQQVYFNFGQTTFKYPPKRVDFRDFFRHPSNEHTPSKPPISFKNVTVTSSQFTVDSQVTSKDITIQHNSQPSTSSSSNQVTSNRHKRSSSIPLCDICQQPQSTKRLRFECCDHLKFCLNCAHVLGNCHKCLAEKHILQMK